MSLLQKAAETFDNYFHYASKQRENHSMMAPVSHIVTRANIVISLDTEGNFVDANPVGKDAPKIIIPATEASANRTSAPCAHPLFDQLAYLMPENSEKYSLYIEQLRKWGNSEFSHPKLRPVLSYVTRGTIVQDLLKCGVIKAGTDGRPEDEKQMISWRVYGKEPSECWLDESLFEAFTGFYEAYSHGEEHFCMVEGKQTRMASQHPKGIVSINGNAKLISANDSSGFTYRGRFTEEWQAASVGYQTSQKAHNALRWLVQEQGIHIGGRTFLCWNSKGKILAPIIAPFMKPEGPVFRPSDYKEALRKKLISMRDGFEPDDDAIIAVFDAATTGRLALAYYSEQRAMDLLQRLHDWEINCCWPHKKNGIASPDLRQIIHCAFGNRHEEKGKEIMKADDRVLKQQMQRLVLSRINGGTIGADIVKGLTDKWTYSQDFDRELRDQILFVACAVLRKYRKDLFKEEWQMALEPKRMDRSYQFGRLLAILEKVERDTYSSGESREPNAIRLQAMFSRRPMDTAHQLEKQLEQAYFPRLGMGSRIWYKNLIGEVMDMISCFPEEQWNRPLESTYMMGYYLQRADLYTAKKEQNTEVEENEEA